MAFPATDQQLPTPSDTPKEMDQDAPSPSAYANHSSTWTPIDTMTPISTNPSRKRSRDETAFDVEIDGGYFASVSTPAPIPEEEPIYGEGMVLLNPKTGMSVGADSQTGTWYEEKADETALREEITAAYTRPKMPTSRKSMRMSQSSIKLPLDTVNTSIPASPPKTAGDRPEVDEATIALGIGWTKMESENEDLQTAARGWARYINNHYSRDIHGAQVLLKNTSLDAYLVGCQEGFFLFDESLLEGKLVGRTWETCIQNLRSQPWQFEGAEVLRAERTPGPESTQPQFPQAVQMENWADYDRLNSLNSAPTTNGAMELD
jgi:hypothetical protein